MQKPNPPSLNSLPCLQDPIRSNSLKSRKFLSVSQGLRVGCHSYLEPAATFPITAQLHQPCNTCRSDLASPAFPCQAPPQGLCMEWFLPRCLHGAGSERALWKCHLIRQVPTIPPRSPCSLLLPLTLHSTAVAGPADYSTLKGQFHQS